MQYGTIKKLLSSEYNEFDDTLLIESRFTETSRHGRYVRCVQLGLTSRTFIIASVQHMNCLSETKTSPLNDANVLEIISINPWESLKLTIFKRSKRRSIKAAFVNNSTRYFELGDVTKRKMFWNLWYIFVMELNSTNKMWPFVYGAITTKSHYRTDCQIMKRSGGKKHQRKWNDKNLYLGSKREHEDNVRPVPIPGLGPAEELKLLYLKPRYFGCWEQSEHWVQCGDCSSDCLDMNKSVHK